MFEEKIPISIFGQRYEILGSASETLYYNSLARFVEQKMKEIQDGTNIVSSQKIAVLAALNIADELFRIREDKERLGTNSGEKYDEMIRLLDSALAPIAAAPIEVQAPAPSKTEEDLVKIEASAPEEPKPAAKKKAKPKAAADASPELYVGELF